MLSRLKSVFPPGVDGGERNTFFSVKDQIDQIREKFDSLCGVSNRDRVAFLRAFIRPLTQKKTELDTAEYLLEHGTSGIKKLAALAIDGLGEQGKMTSKLGRYYSPFYHQALQVMERTQGERFPQALEVIASLMNSTKGLMMSGIRSSIQPIAYLAMLSVMIILIFAEQAELIGSFARSKQDVDTLLSTATFLKFGLIPSLILVVIAIFGIRECLRRFPSEWRSERLDNTVLSLYRDYVAYGYLRKYALLRGAGLSGMQIYESLASTGTPYERYHALRGIEMLGSGASTEEHALDTGLLSASGIGMVKLMLKGGNREEIVNCLNEAAHELYDSLNKKVTFFGYLIAAMFWAILVHLVVIVANVMTGVGSTFN